MITLLYVHGFNSSELSFKSQQLKARMQHLGLEKYFLCPRLPWQPAKAIQLLEDIIEEHHKKGHKVALVGSSLGGFYSTYLSIKYDLHAVLVNPAVEAPVLLRHYLGQQINPYTNETYELAEVHMEELERLVCSDYDPQKVWLMVQEQDEVLNYKAALERFVDVQRVTCETGGDHSFIGFERFIDDILRFVGFRNEF